MKKMREAVVAEVTLVLIVAAPAVVVTVVATLGACFGFAFVVIVLVFVLPDASDSVFRPVLRRRSHFRPGR